MKDSILKQRNLALTQLSETPLDLLVIGGGIVGAGIARDASMRGLKTALVEQHDFAFGTSSRSTRLLHGGIRYLAQGRIGLVREASIEKGVLQRIAPHLAKPLAFVFPIYPGADWPLWSSFMICCAAAEISESRPPCPRNNVCRPSRICAGRI
jgi:glycerol-3-phosphate dehydrogenase